MNRLKTRTWILIFVLLMTACLGCSLFLFRRTGAAAFAQISSDGQVIRTVSLSVDQEFTVTTPKGGVNVITVRNGKIAVTEANCPDKYCMLRGWCDQGTQIVCLPNHLLITFQGGVPEVDEIAG